MTEYKFDPTDYQFVPDHFYSDEISVWTTKPVSDGVIGSYVMTYSSGSWTIEEIYLKNKKEHFLTLYRGNIPDQNFGDQLMRNLDLDIPIIQREKLINKIIE
jgi:hypothetical protein